MSSAPVLVSAAVLAAMATQAPAATYVAATQFSTKSNTDTRHWSYRISDGTGHDGNYALLTNVGTFSATKNGRAIKLKSWDTPTAPFDVPEFLSNKNTVQVTFDSNSQQIALPATTLLAHPGYSKVAAVLSFLAPKRGTATVTYDITHLDWSCGGEGAGIDWSIEKNFGNGALASGQLFSPNAQNIDSTGTQILTVAVAKGDRLNVIIDPVANPPFCDSTGMAISVSLP